MMKKYFGLIILFLLVSANLLAQSTFGIKGGINNYTLVGDDFKESGEMKNGYSAGIFYNYRVNATVSLQTELLYSTKGGGDWARTISISGWNFYSPPSQATSKTVYDRIEASYIELPIIIEITLGNYFVSPYVLAGPSIGYLLKSKLIVTGAERYESDVTDEAEILDYSYILGAGFNFNIFGLNSFIEARINPSINSCFKGAQDTRNKAVLFSIGINIF